MKVDLHSHYRLALLSDQLLRLPASARAVLLEALQAVQQTEAVAGSAARALTVGLSQALAHSGRAFSGDALEKAIKTLGDLTDSSRRRRIVVTGMGAITAVGNTTRETWQNLLAGQSGIDWVTLFDAAAYPTRIAAEVKGWDPGLYIERKEARRMARCSQFAVGAATQALADAGLDRNGELGDRTGVIIGTGLGGFEIYEQTVKEAAKRGAYRVTPSSAMAGLPNMPAFHVSQTFGAKGPLNTTVTACAAGTQAIGEGVEMIRHGLADRMLVGGVEALVCEPFFAGFTAMRAISIRNDPPAAASRPFDANRDGFIIGEGAAVLVLEDLDSALARGATVYAEILGHSASADAYHVAVPEPRGEGAQRAMRWALLSAEVNPEQIDYINTHGTSTPLNDRTETLAIKAVFGAHAYRLAANSTKSMIGHSFGGAGAIEGLATIMSVYTDQLHPTINYETPDPECDLDYVPNLARRQPVNIALSNSFGLGGQNACLVIGKYRHHP